MRSLFFPRAFLVVAVLLAVAVAVVCQARPRVKVATEPAFLPGEQNEILKKEVLEYVRENAAREPGEGWLFLSKHYDELEKPEQSLDFLQRIVRTDTIDPRLKGEAELLMAEFLTKQKNEEQALKEVDRLISWNPDRDLLVRAKIERAKLLGRGLTRMDDLFKAFKRYYQSFPELSEIEEIPYLMGFERGYDLEIGMKALEAWEEVASFPEREASQVGNLHIGLMYAYDLSSPDKAPRYLSRIPRTATSTPAIDALFVRATLLHFSNPPRDAREALSGYRDFLSKTKDLPGYRIGTILTADLLSTRLQDTQAAIELLSTLASAPPHLVGTQSISLEKRSEEDEETKSWATLAWKIAGYYAEFRLHDPDRACAAYQKAIDSNKSRRAVEPDPWLAQALARCEPKVSPPQMMFDMAYEKYRGRDIETALRLYENFIASYPDHQLTREAMFRAAQITDDDLKDFDEALSRYQRYLIQVVPKKSTWKLDTLYDWGRIDEVRYRIGNLLSLHKKDPMGALKIFDDLSTAYPDSFWAMQGMKDSIHICKEDLGDENTALEKMVSFIEKYPESKDAQTFRKKLFEQHLSLGQSTKALALLKDFLDHSLPSDAGYLEMKRTWRDLAFRLREEEIRKRLPTAGPRDRIDLFMNLANVLSLASTPAPLEALAKEIETEDLPDEVRWGLTYHLGRTLYRDFPGPGKAVFQKLADSASGPARLACLLTLGNIEFRVEKSVQKSIGYYEAAASLSTPVDPLFETPLYRLGRLYLVTGDGSLGIETLNAFLRRYPRSRHYAKACLALGEVYAFLHHPVQAARFLRQVVRLSPALAEKARLLLDTVEKAMLPDEWLALQAKDRKQQKDKAIVLSAASGTPDAGALRGTPPSISPSPTPLPPPSPGDSLTDEEMANLEPEDLYERYAIENAKGKPDPVLAVRMLLQILKKRGPAEVTGKAVRHYISWRFFRKRDGKAFVAEIQPLLTERNYPTEFAELLFRLAQAEDYSLRDYEAANKSYFEYLSFFTDGKRALASRERIPQVFEAAKDTKNALRFYVKLIDDSTLPGASRVDASIRKARIEELDQRKEEAIRTLEASLAFDSPRKGEIYLRLEKLTDNFEYVRKALETPGDEKFRFEAMQRLIKKAEKSRKYDEASALLEANAGAFNEPKAALWIEKKRADLGKRDEIAAIEKQIETFPEDPNTPARLFKLATMVEGAENTKYRSQDLFYEITLVYPHSEFFRESKIRAENTRAIRSLEELDDMLKSGVKPDEGEEILLERSRLYKDSLQDSAKAGENLEALFKLYPAGTHRDEAYLKMGDLALSSEKSAEKALAYWEAGLSASRDSQTREQLTRRINDLRKFRERILYSESRSDHDEGVQTLFRVWRLEGDVVFALSLVTEALAKLENRPQTARLTYLQGRLLEEDGRPTEALAAYEKALRCLYHPGCRKDMLLYRMARIQIKATRAEEAYKLFSALANRYPRSLLSRSALYNLYKTDMAAKRFTQAHLRLNQLLVFNALVPVQRAKLIELERSLTAMMNISEMNRLRKFSKTGASEFPYYIGKVLENDLHDSDQAIAQYEDYLKTNPPQSRARDLMLKIADLYEQKRDFVKAVGTLDALLGTLPAAPQNIELIVRIGNLVEDKLGNPELADLFYRSILDDYAKVPQIRNFARAKIRVVAEKRLAKAVKPKGARKVKREYSEEDQDILSSLDEIKQTQIDELQDYLRAEREMVQLWDDNVGSPATLDIMKELDTLCQELLLDPQKSAEYMQRWLDENPDDPELANVTLKLYEMYMTRLRDGQKALLLLESFVRANPTSPFVDEIQLKIGKANEQLILNFEEARRVYQRIIDTRRNDPYVQEAFFRMGFLLREGFADYSGAVKIWEEMNNLFYQNPFAADAQYAIAYTYEVYLRDYTKARANYEKLLNQYPNSPLQNQVREALIRIGGK